MSTHRIEVLVGGEKAAKALAEFLASQVPANFVAANDGTIDGVLVVELSEVTEEEIEEESNG